MTLSSKKAFPGIICNLSNSPKELTNHNNFLSFFRQFLKPSHLDWAIPSFAEFYLNELDSLPDSTSLTWLIKVLLKRLRSGHFSPHLLKMSMALAAAHCPEVQTDLDAVALSDLGYVAVPTLADLERMANKSSSSEDRDDASMLSENDDNGNSLVESTTLYKQLLTRQAFFWTKLDSTFSLKFIQKFYKT